MIFQYLVPYCRDSTEIENSVWLGFQGCGASHNLTCPPSIGGAIPRIKIPSKDFKIQWVRPRRTHVLSNIFCRQSRILRHFCSNNKRRANRARKRRHSFFSLRSQRGLQQDSSLLQKLQIRAVELLFDINNS